jgi:periplasmic protein TonB
MSETTRSVSPYLDEPWRRLAWVAPLAIVVWAILLTAFALVLDQSGTPPVELKPVEARLIELPAPAGLQGGASAPRPAPHVVPKAKPHVARPVPIHHTAKPLPEVPPSPSGTASKAAEAPAASGAGVAGGTGVGSGAGLGSDSSGARAIFAPTPEIPDDIRADAFSGVAFAHFKVSYSGDVQVSLTQPTTSPRLNEILLDTLKQWRFFPAMKNGVAVDSEFDVRIPITVE